MRGYVAFTKKEFLEQLRTFKCLIILCVFFLFGMMSPVLAKIMPDILSSMKVEGMVFELTKAPTAVDAYGQFFKNVTQMGILVLLLVFGGMLSNELGKGTLINILAKGLSRPAVILSKFTAAVALWTVGYLLAAATTFGYTVYLFKDSTVSNLIFSLFCLWLFGCFILALILLSSSIAAGSFGGLILTGITLVILLMISGLPKIHQYNPIALASDNVYLLQNTKEIKDLVIAIVVTIIATIACLVASILIFGKKKL